MRTRYLLVILALYTSAAAQRTMSLDEAITIGLKNNFGILVARNNADIDKINNTAGNAGMLPTLNINGNGNYEVNDIHQKLNDGTTNNYSAIPISMATVGAELNWKLFDGGKMFVTKNKLNEIEALGEIQFREQVLQILYNIIAAYYDIVRQKQQLISLNEVINFNNERVKIAQTGYNAGSLIKQDLLQAKIDLNLTTELVINQQFVIEESRKNLNVLLSLNADEMFEVADSIPLDVMLDNTTLLKMLDSTNTTILSYQKQMEIARLNLKEFNRLYSPTLQLKSGYYLSQSNNLGGSQIENRATGPSIGGSLVIPLYNAGETRRKVSVAKIELLSAEYNYQSVKLHAVTELKNALIDYENHQKLLQIEEENILLTRENLDISLHRLRLGQTTSLEVRQAQEDFVRSSTRLIDFKYNLKIAETRLKQLVAQL